MTWLRDGRLESRCFDHRDDDDRTREILRMAIEFLRTHLQPERAGSEVR